MPKQTKRPQRTKAGQVAKNVLKRTHYGGVIKAGEVMSRRAKPKK